MAGGSVRRRAVIEGVVQGVGFRFSTVAEAERLGLTGWVRNRDDGSVETEFQGEAESVEAMTSWVRSGPPSASVSGVAVEDVPADARASDFRIR